MDFNPVDVQKHLKGANYPASGEQLGSTAEGNKAPSDLVRRRSQERPRGWRA